MCVGMVILMELNPKTTYFISDTHFNHVNIVKYCNRPFDSVEEMNNTIIENWNKTVKENDIVYFLGDFVLSKNKGTMVKKYKDLLNGEIIFIKGNHDKKGKKFEIIEYEDYKFMLIHNPDSSYTFDFNGWIIHGHHHANDLDKYPLINPKMKRINVSVEVLNYKPISFENILKLIRNGKFIKKLSD